MEGSLFVRRTVSTVQQFGLLRAIYDFGLRVINRLVFLRLLVAVFIQTPDSASLKRRPEYRYGFLGRALVLAFAVDPEYEMNERFLEEALGKGDRCYGIVDGKVLASYGWYSTKPTVALTDDLELRFDPAYVYMYKGFTHEAYRGQRLHAAGMALALEEFQAEGQKGLVSYVESNNFSSLKSCARMGYETFGHALVLRVFGRYFIATTPGCKERGFDLAPLVRSS